MKRDVSGFVTKCLVCQRVKEEHQVPSRLLQPIRIPEWKWDRITMDFVVRLPLIGRESRLSLGHSGPIDQVSSLPTSENQLFT